MTDQLEYLAALPKALPPDGRVLVHNQVYPVARRPGTRGSRCWLQQADGAGAMRLRLGARAGPALSPQDCAMIGDAVRPTR